MDRRLEEDALNLERFIKRYIPKGWTGPVSEFTFAPYISNEEIQSILNNKIPDLVKFNPFYIKDAINEWLKTKNISDVKKEEIKLRVWWIPQIPMEPFHVEVSNTQEAIKIIDTLAKYDLFQLNNNIKPDYANTGGLEFFNEEEKEWEEWSNEEGETIDDLIKIRSYISS